MPGNFRLVVNSLGPFSHGFFRDEVAFLGSESVHMAFRLPGYWSEGCTNAPGPIF